MAFRADNSFQKLNSFLLLINYQSLFFDYSGFVSEHIYLLVTVQRGVLPSGHLSGRSIRSSVVYLAQRILHSLQMYFVTGILGLSFSNRSICLCSRFIVFHFLLHLISVTIPAMIMIAQTIQYAVSFIKKPPLLMIM